MDRNVSFCPDFELACLLEGSPLKFGAVSQAHLRFCFCYCFPISFSTTQRSRNYPWFYIDKGSGLREVK